MPARLARIPVLLLSLAALAQTALALPPMGAFSLDFGGSLSKLSTSDIEKVYAPA